MNKKNSLIKRFEEFSEKHEFKPGDLVRWKPGMKNRDLPRYWEPVVVVEVLAVPVIDIEKVSGEQFFHEPLDIKLGSIDPNDDEFMVYHYDSRRFQPYKG